jgi:hypothetical protein
MRRLPIRNGSFFQARDWPAGPDISFHPFPGFVVTGPARLRFKHLIRGWIARMRRGTSLLPFPMKNSTALRQARKIAALSGSVALLLSAFAPATRAADNVYTGTFPLPLWDSGIGANWSLGVPPTAADNAIFPVSILPTALGAAFGLAADGKEIPVTIFSPGPSPIAANLVFLDNYILRKSPPLYLPLIPSAIGITLARVGSAWPRTRRRSSRPTSCLPPVMER